MLAFVLYRVDGVGCSLFPWYSHLNAYKHTQTHNHTFSPANCNLPLNINIGNNKPKCTQIEIHMNINRVDEQLCWREVRLLEIMCWLCGGDGKNFMQSTHNIDIRRCETHKDLINVFCMFAKIDQANPTPKIMLSLSLSSENFMKTWKIFFTTTKRGCMCACVCVCMQVRVYEI